jgi:hypothetical protein
MSNVLVGSAYGVLELRSQQFDQGVDASLAKLAQLRQAFSQGIPPLTLPPVGGLAGGSVAGSTPAGTTAAASTAPAAAANENAAALSREALAAGDAARALQLMDQALGKSSAETSTSTSTTLASVRAEASLAATLGDRTRAIELLEAALGQQATRTTEVINVERQLATIENQAITTAQREADVRLRVAQADARALAVKKDYAGALALLTEAQATNANASAGTLATVGAQVSQYEAVGTATGALSTQLSALLNPLALAAVGFGAAAKAIGSFGEALDLIGKIQEERTAFGGILGDFANGNAILDEATKRTRAYGFTQKETTDAFRDLAPVIRESTSSTKDQAEALARISVLKPEDPVRALTGAIEGIKTGRFRELSKELGLSASEQASLKAQVDSGKDAFLALNDVLDRHGITLKVAADRMDGYEGATRRAGQAQEDLQKAEGKFAAGPGLAILNQRIKITNDATDAFSGSLIGLNNVIGDSVGTFNPLLGAITSYNNAVLGAGRDALVWAGIIQETTPEILGNTSANQANGTAISQSAQLAQQAATAQRAYADSLELTGVRARAAAQATEQKSATDKVAALDAQTHAIAEEHLAQQAEDAARALLVAGPAGARTAALLAGSSGQVDVLTAAYYRLFAAQQSTAKGATQQDAANFRSMELFGQTAAQTTAALQKQTAADLARSQGIIQNGTATQKIAELQRLYNDAVRQSGKDSAQAITAQNALTAAQQAAEKAGGRKRVDAAASTALQLQNVEENSQAQLLKAQREGLERLRDQREEFDVHRARAQEDNAEKRRSLLAHGQRAQAAELQRDFEKEQKRNQEDFDRQRRRTVRNNQEASGDITGGLERRQGQISERAALRGSRTGAAVDLGANATPSAKSGGAAAAGGARVIQVVITGRVDLDGREVGTLIYNAGLREQIDTDLALTIAATSAPGSGQSAVGGNG